MNKVKTKRILAVVLSMIIMVTAFTGCTSESKKPDATGGQNEQTLVYNMSAECASIDPAINDTVVGATIINTNFEGLTRQDEDGNIKEGVAKSWDISSDGLVYTFALREDAKWSDGQPIKVEDFEYAWKRALDPKLAAGYAFFLNDYIKNAQEFYEGNAKWEDVGIKIKDDKTIEITLKKPTGYFLQLVASPIYMPLRADIIDKDLDKWTQNGDTYIGNGPFQMVKWIHNDSITFTKNTNYWDAKNVKLDSMTFVMVNDASSALTSWEKGEVDVIETVPSSEIPRMIEEKKITFSPYLSNIFVYFNTTNKVLSDVKVRKALQLSIDRDAIVTAVTRAGEKPAYAFVSPGIKEPDGKTEFRDKGGDLFKADIEQAKKLLAEAGYPDGKDFPEITYLYNTSDNNKKIAESIQAHWKQNLNIDVKLENIEWSVFIDRRRKEHDFDMARGSWVGDYADPMTFLEMFDSKSNFDDAQYNNPEYDKIIGQINAETNSEKRSDLMHQAEKILMDDAVIAPIYFPFSKLYIKDGVKGLYTIPTGTLYFDHVTIEK